MNRLICWIFGHRWRTGYRYEKTNVATGAGFRLVRCDRCSEVRKEAIPAQREDEQHG